MKNKFVFLLTAFILFSGGHSLAQEGPAQQKISLDIKGMDVVDVLKMLAGRSGINIVVGKNVTGRVTLFLKDVDIWDALEIILLSNDLAYEKKGDIINVMTQRDYELLYGERYQDKKEAKIIQLKYAKAADLSRALNQIKSNLGKVVVDEGSNTLALIDVSDKIKEMEEFIKNSDLPVQTKVFSLDYALADKLTPKIQEAITKGVGSIRMDERTNKIVVTDYPQKLEEIGKIISAFDEKTQQVLIDAQIIQLTPSDQLQVGVDVNYWINKYFDVRMKLPINTANALLIGTTTTDPSEPGQYKAILDALRTIKDIKVLASPRIMALNNQEAKILVGKKDAYITSTTSQAGTGTTVTSQSVNFVDTGIALYVTPTINRDGFITMKIKPTISESVPTLLQSEDKETTVPIITTSEAETTIMVKDGVTIIIAGLKKDNRTKTVKKIPLLGDIPGLGFLFRSTDDNVTQTDLVILLTPHIISGESTLTSFDEIPPKEGAVLSMKDGKIIKEKVSLSQQEKVLNSLTSVSVDNREYCRLITDRIQQFAKRNSPKKGRKGEVGLKFTVSGRGEVLEEPVVVNATDSSLIPYAVKAIKEASPFPPFSKSLEKDRETFKVSLSYE